MLTIYGCSGAFLLQGTFRILLSMVEQNKEQENDRKEYEGRGSRSGEEPMMKHQENN